MGRKVLTRLPVFQIWPFLRKIRSGTEKDMSKARFEKYLPGGNFSKLADHAHFKASPVRRLGILPWGCSRIEASFFQRGINRCGSKDSRLRRYLRGRIAGSLRSAVRSFCELQFSIGGDPAVPGNPWPPIHLPEVLHCHSHHNSTLVQFQLSSSQPDE
jgi:hypothetical protein